MMNFCVVIVTLVVRPRGPGALTQTSNNVWQETTVIITVVIIIIIIVIIIEGVLMINA